MAPTAEPQKLLLRREDVLAWTGISPAEFKKLVKAKVITGIQLRKGGRCHYHREKIRAALLKPFEL